MIQVVKASQLGSKQLRHVQQLVATCHQHDGYLSKFYWYSTTNRQNDEISEFVLYKDKVCVGYLAVYQFAENEAEICVVVHPSFRRIGIFSRLWMEACLELHQRDIERCLFIQHPDSDAARLCLEGLGARYFRSEHRLQRCLPIDIKPKKGFVLRPATIQDVHLLARMDLACFDGDYKLMVSRLEEVMGEPERQIFIGEQDGEAVGKVHVLFGQDVLLHDFCVLPKFQKKGFGKLIISMVANDLIALGNSAVTIEVGSDEFDALKMYKSVGFEPVVTYRYWLYQMGEQFQHYETLH